MRSRARVAAVVALLVVWAVGPAAAQTEPPQCQPGGAPARIAGRIVEIDARQGRVTVQQSDGSTQEFEASAAALRDLKVGDRIEATLRPLRTC